MERALLNRSKGLTTQRLFVMQDKIESSALQKTVPGKRAIPVEDKENLNPDTLELAQQESRQRRQWLPQNYNGTDTAASKPGEDYSTPKDCKSRQPLRDITPVFQKVTFSLLCVSSD